MIVWHEKALKDLQSLPKDVQKRIRSVVEKLPRGDIKLSKVLTYYVLVSGESCSSFKVKTS